ncbi:MAG: hypothetical protein Q8O94_03830 [bacterium]|nr:hypothetical protein [bacterium]
MFFILGDSWQGMLPNFTDTLNFARVHTIGEGHLTAGNPYFLEHSDGPPLVVFGGAWLNAIPLLAGVPFTEAMTINFVIWSLLFAVSFYWLCRTLRIHKWIAVAGTIFIYLQSFLHVWRPANMQPVYPFFFLFYVALLYFMREQNRRNMLYLAISVGVGFYLFAYLWQMSVITIGLLFLYALILKKWSLMRTTLASSVIGVAIGSPVLFYTLWLSRAYPYFWESVGRLGLVNTHLPMAEVIYSGGWIGVTLTLLAVLYWRVRTFREDAEFLSLGLFLTVSGLGIWVLQGSNLITGKLLETGEHAVSFMIPWFVLAVLSLSVFLYAKRTQLSRSLQIYSAITLLLLSGVCIRYHWSFPLPISDADRNQLQTMQPYAKPFAWLQGNEGNPVVVWGNPSNAITSNIPVFTKHFTLYHYWGMLELLPDSEVLERYLISQYFDDPTIEYLKNVDNMKMYLGRHDLPHASKTIERGIKICRILFFWDKNKECGTPPTPTELLGDKFFVDLEHKFRTNIKPNIKAYLKKYHVSYILKDKVLDPQYRPEVLGAVLVYTNDQYEIYRL